MDHTNKYTAQDFADTERSTFAHSRKNEPRAHRAAPHNSVTPTSRKKVEHSASARPAEIDLTDEQICEQSPYWLADWNLSGMH